MLSRLTITDVASVTGAEKTGVRQAAKAAKEAIALEKSILADERNDKMCKARV